MIPAAERADAPIDLQPQQEAPEHRCDRRRFLVWALMAGYVKPERMTERIVAEIEGTEAA